MYGKGEETKRQKTKIEIIRHSANSLHCCSRSEFFSSQKQKPTIIFANTSNALGSGRAMFLSSVWSISKTFIFWLLIIIITNWTEHALKLYSNIIRYFAYTPALTHSLTHSDIRTFLLYMIENVCAPTQFSSLHFIVFAFPFRRFEHWFVKLPFLSVQSGTF